jgi:hypothetical protein
VGKSARALVEKVVRRIDIQHAATCTVVVRLNHNCDLHIRTTASHALDVLSGRTVFPAKDTTVFDLNGKKLSVRELKRLDEGEPKA